MTETVTFIEKIRSLLESREYHAALAAIERAGSPETLADIPSEDHMRISLLYAKVNYYCNDYAAASSCLSGLLPVYEGIETDIDYIFVRSQIDLIEGATTRAHDFLKASISMKRPEEEEFFLRFCLGKACFWKGDYLNASLLLEACHQYYLSADDPFMLANVFYMQGYTAFQRCRFEEADGFYRKAADHFDSVSSQSGMASVSHMSGILAYRTGNYPHAEDMLRKARRYFLKRENLTGIAESTIALGRISMYRGDYAEASKMMRKAYEESEKSGYRRGKALASEFLGECACIEKRFDQALAYLLEAEKIATEISPTGDIAVEVCRRLGDLHLSMGKLDEAEEALERGLDLARDLHDEYELGCILRAFAILQESRKKYELSRSYFTEAISILGRIGESYELAKTYMAAARSVFDLARVPSQGAAIASDRSIAAHRLDDARAYATEAAHLYESIGLHEKGAECEGLANRILAEFYHEKDLTRSMKIEFSKEWLYGGFIVARSDHMKKTVSKAVTMAPSTVPVLITGETGTGKEVIARLIHMRSDRSSGPFIAVNCASIPDSVFESEMFGHRKGAFTGADRDRTGIIERASGGTLFLDEISELSITQQAKLLRVFQEQKIRKVGESGERAVDVRLVSASNQNIEALLRSGRLRKDFYFRVLTASIELEPLRRRKKDIYALFSYYMQESGHSPEIEEGVPELLKVYDWPGNVRELMSVVRILALIAEEGRIIGKNDLPMKIRNHHILGRGMVESTAPNLLKTREIPAIGLVRDHDEVRSLVISSLVKTNGNKTAAARELGVSRSTLYRTLRDMGI